MAEQTDDDQAAVSVLMGLGNLVCHQVSENTVADLPPPPVRVAYNCKICHHRVFCGRKWHEESKECEKNGACRDPEDAGKCPFKTNNETVWKQLHKAAYTAQKAAQKRKKQEQEQAKKLASKKQKLDLKAQKKQGRNLLAQVHRATVASNYESSDSRLISQAQVLILPNSFLFIDTRASVAGESLASRPWFVPSAQVIAAQQVQSLHLFKETSVGLLLRSFMILFLVISLVPIRCRPVLNQQPLKWV